MDPSCPTFTGYFIAKSSGVCRIVVLRVPSVNRIFPLRLLTAGAISLFLNITGAIAPVAPVLNTPLFCEKKPVKKILV